MKLYKVFRIVLMLLEIQHFTFLSSYTEFKRNLTKSRTKSCLLQLNYIRRCGFADDIFYIEVGRSAVTGDGEFWMAVEDNNIALNMYDVITTAMRNSKSIKDEVGPRQRTRSSSANEASKPISVLQRRYTSQKLHGFPPLGKS